MLQLIEVIGIITFALSGIAEARRKKMDLVGVITVALVTAFGGGTLRDLLLDRRPLFWIAREEYLLLVLALAVGAFLFRSLASIPAAYLLLPDALGLGLFSVAGAGYAAAAGTPLLSAAILGVITGIFGGVLRDVLCNEVPYIFRNTHLYATCAFIGCWAYLLADRAGVDQGLSVPLATVLIAGTRLLALRYNIRVPGGQ